jgi:hypothetical protein
MASTTRGGAVIHETVIASNIDSIFDATPGTPAPDLSIAQLRDLLRTQANVLTSVATGGDRIQDVNDAYIRNGVIVRENFERRCLDNPYPWADLGEW